MYHVTLGKKLGASTVIPVDFDKFPDAVKRHIIAYGVQQFFIDKANTTKTAEGKAEVVKKAIQDANNGILGKRNAGVAPADEDTICKRIAAHRAFAAKYGKETDAGKKFAGLGKTDKAKFLDELFAKNADKLAAALAKVKAEREAIRAAKSGKVETAIDIAL